MRPNHRRFLILSMAFVFLLGLLLFLYPYLHGAILERQQKQKTQLFLSELPAPDFTPAGNNTSDATVPSHEVDNPLDRLRQDAEAYNSRIFEERQALFDSPAAYEQPSLLLSDYGLTDEVFAVLTIPALDLEMPVFLGANSSNLSIGAAHLSETSLPIGGENTNCVIAGHRGWKGAAYFKNLPALQIGDEVSITNLWETLTYHVIAKKDISATDTDSILIQPGEDLLSLITCDYGVNGVKYRFLVICERAADQ